MTKISWRNVIAQNAKVRAPYALKIKGKIPTALSGTLFRNGPGVFERNGVQKKILLDGDGLIQSFRITKGKVLYQSAFVQTPKFQREEKEGRFLWRTWTTNAPGGLLHNMGRIPPNQSGVSVWHQQGNLFSFDESTQPYCLDPQTLKTKGRTDFGLQKGAVVYAAHPKWDPKTGEWLHFGLSYGLSMHADITIFKKLGALSSHRRFKLPWLTYMHDWFVTENHLIFLMHPVRVNLFSFLLQGKTLRDAMTWQPHLGNQVWVFPRYGDLGKPKIFETEALWMWHGFNAYEQGQDIILDFIGYEGPGNFLGAHAPLQLKADKKPQWDASGLVRYRLSFQKSLKRETFVFGGNNDFPSSNPFGLSQPTQHGYYVHSKTPERHFFNCLCHFDYQKNVVETYDFGPDVLCLEPVFATSTHDKKTENAFLLVPTQSLKPPFKGALQIFKAQDITKGPLATALLAHPSPMSFHGCWVPAR